MEDGIWNISGFHIPPSNFHLLTMRILGIDFGAKRIGLALGDTEARLASPWAVLRYDHRNDAVREIKKIIEAEKIEKIVVGMPYPFIGPERETEQIKLVRGFMDDLRVLGLAMEEADERLSSQLAIRFMHERGEKGKRDDLAAAAILQTWLDKTA